MATGQLAAVLRHIRKLASARPAGEVTDGQLLERFVTQHDTLAFELLVRRHERMVWGVCRRLLANVQDAEDAFQAAFVVLVRKAGSICKRESVGSWLYQVAYRIALRARAHRARITARERQVDASPVDPHEDTASVEGRDLRSLLDQELNQLPEKYRTPVVLCYLEGKSYQEVAQQLGCPKGTVATRLTRARELLHGRLSRRGLGVTVGLLVTGLSEEAASASVPIALVASTVQGATLLSVGGPVVGSGVSAQVATLAEGLLHAMFLTKMKFAMAILLALGVVGAGAGVVVHQSLLAKAGQVELPEGLKEVAQKAAKPNPEGERQSLRTDFFSDPLPPGALLRLGTLRQRYHLQLRWNSQLLPDGSTLLLGAPNEVRWLERATGRKIDSWPLPKEDVVCGFSPDGRLALLAECEKYDVKTLHLWDLRARKKLRTFQGQSDLGSKTDVYAIFAPDGKVVATNSGVNYNPGLVRVWDIATGRELWHEGIMGFYDQGLTPFGFLPDGETLVLLEHSQNRVSLRERLTGREQRSFETMPRDESRNSKLSPDGKTVFMGTAGTAVRAWDVATGKELPPLGGHEGQAHSVAISRDSKTILTGGLDPFVLLWDWPTGKLRRKLEFGTRKSLDRMDVSADGKRAEIILWGENALRFYDLDTGRELPSPAEAHRGAIHGMEIAADGKLVSAGGDNTIRVWDLHTGRQLNEIRTDHPVGTMTLALGRDGRLVATAEINRSLVTVQDRDTGALARTIDTGAQSVSWVAFTSEEGLLAVLVSRKKPGQGGGEPRFVAFWDIDHGREVRRVAVDAEVLSPDGRLLAGRSGDRVRIWEVTTGRERQALPHKGIYTIAFSPDARMLAYGDSSGVALLEIASGKERGRIDAPAAGSWALRFSPDGRWLAEGDDRAIQVCDVLGGQVVHTFTGHDAAVTRLAFTPDDRILASASYDSTVLLWDLKGVTAQQLRPQNRLSDAALMAAWKNLASADAQLAYRALGLLTEAPSQSLPLFRERLQPAAAPDADQIERWLAELDGSRFADRERAKRELERLEGQAEPALRRLLANAPTPEDRQRAEDLLARLQAPITDPEMLRLIRAVEVLEYLATGEAKQLLEEVARGAPESRLTQEAKGALGRLTKRPSRVP